MRKAPPLWALLAMTALSHVSCLVATLVVAVVATRRIGPLRPLAYDEVLRLWHQSREDA